MLRMIRFLFASFWIFSAGILTCPPLYAVEFSAKVPETVSFVDLNRYLGKWYEIASIPTWFQRGCAKTEANYSLNNDGTIKVVNICVRDEQESKAVGEAYVAVRLTNSKLKVTFFWPFYGDYWIFDLHQDYEWALVGGRDGKTLWILSREKTMPDVTYSQILDKIKVLGFDPNLLKKTAQN